LTKNPDAMITALRKIEGRGELEGATSAVMEMCVDNPRSGFADLFATHPSIEARVEALVKFAGGRDPGPIALPQSETPPDESEEQRTSVPEIGPAAPGDDKPFLPSQPPLQSGESAAARGQPGPWEPPRRD
jgi:heat shock protein HtpX